MSVSDPNLFEPEAFEQIPGQMTFEQTPCDICGKAILPTDRVSRTDDEVAHVSCVSAWFRGNFGREVLS